MRGRVAAVLLVLAAGGLAWWLLRAESPPPDAPAAQGQGDAAPEAPAPLPGLEGRDAGGAEPEAPGPVPAAGAVRAVGRIVDERRRPVPGCRVSTVMDGQETDRGTTGEDGRFDLGLVPADGSTHRGLLSGRLGSRGLALHVYMSADTSARIDFGTLVLVEEQTLEVRVTHAGEAVVGAEVVVAEGAAGIPGRVVHAGRSGADGVARFRGLLEKAAWVFGVKAGLGRGTAEAQLPASAPVDLVLPDDREATIRVVRGDDGRVVAGAQVFLTGAGTHPPPRGLGCLPPLGDLRTGDDGTVHVTGLPAGFVYVRATAPDLAMRDHGSMVSRVGLGEGEREVTITLVPLRSVRFPIRPDSVRVPPDGAALSLRRYQPGDDLDAARTRARIEGGMLVLEPFPPAFDWGHVVTDDGLWAQWRAPLDKDEGEAVTFRPVYALAVHLTWPDGAPAVGEILWASFHPRGRAPHARTDSEGRVRFEHCVAESANVFWTPVESGFGVSLGSTSLLGDPGTLELTLSRPAEIVVAVRVDGEPRLPDRCEVRVPERAPGRPDGTRTLYREVEEDPETCELRFRWPATPEGMAPPVTLRAERLSEVTVQPVRQADGTWRAVVDLSTAPALRVRVKRPAGMRAWLVVERWDASSERWVALIDDPVFRAGQREVDGVHTFVGFAAGRYRLKDLPSGTTSDPFELVAGGKDLERELDLGAVVSVKGRLIVPAGESAAYATVRIEGRRDGLVSLLNPLAVAPDGTFEYVAPRGDVQRLVVEHPLLELEDPSSEIVVGTTTPVLRMRSGPQVRFRLAGAELTTQEPAPNASPAWWSPVQVRYSQAGAWEPGARTYPAVAKQGACRAGAPGRGTWTVRIEQPGFVPVTLDDVVVGDAPADLGTLDLTEGSALTVRLYAGRTGLPRTVRIQAVLVGERPYERWGGRLEGAEPPSVTLKGLGAGTFKVRVYTGYGPESRPVAEQEVTLDGAAPAILDVRLP